MNWEHLLRIARKVYSSGFQPFFQAEATAIILGGITWEYVKSAATFLAMGL